MTIVTLNPTMSKRSSLPRVGVGVVAGVVVVVVAVVEEDGQVEKSKGTCLSELLDCFPALIGTLAKLLSTPKMKLRRTRRLSKLQGMKTRRVKASPWAGMRKMHTMPQWTTLSKCSCLCSYLLQLMLHV